MNTNQRQAQALADLLAKTCYEYTQAEEKAGTPMLGNDIVSALAHVLGGVISPVPEGEQFDRLFAQVGQMVLQSVGIHRFTKRMVDGEGGTFLMTEDEHGNVVVEELSGGPLQ